jgi:teichuronic acid biosynthesis glycosyltransferase TuaC
MKVAVVTQYCPTPHQRWAGHSAYQTLRHLAKFCELKVFYPEATYPRLLTPAAALRPAGAPDARPWSPPDLDISYIPYPVLPVVSRPLNGFTMAAKLLPHVRRFNPEIILNYVVYPDGFAAVRIGLTLKTPVVLTAIGSDLNRIPDPLCGVLTRYALRHADFVTTVSRDLGKTAAKLGADPARVRPILNGCDTTVFHPQDQGEARRRLGLDSQAKIVVYVGRLDVRKGLLELVEAITNLRLSRPNLHCYIIGDGPDRKLVTDAIVRHAAGSAITLVPSCLTDQVALWMAASDLVTLPSYREGCPNVVIEALAAGRPVVATNIGGIPELMDDASGRLVPPMDAIALSTALGEVLDTTWDAEAIASRHSRSWVDVAREVYEVLERTLAKPIESNP